MATCRCSCSMLRNFDSWKSWFRCSQKTTTVYLSSLTCPRRRSYHSVNNISGSTFKFTTLDAWSTCWTSGIWGHGGAPTVSNGYRVVRGNSKLSSSSSSVNSDENQKQDESLSTKDEEKKTKDEEKKKRDEFQRRATKYTLLGLVVLCSTTSGYLVAAWGAPHKDEDGNEVKDEFSHLPAWRAYLYRTWKEVVFYDKMIKEPSRERLLPDPLTEPYFQPPYTLVIEMTGVLVHPDWTYKTGWRFKKRPGVDFFLQQAGPPLFEIVIYTSEQGFTAYPILETLDPNGYIMYKLYRDATRYMGGHHVKDLSFLNRDLSRVIFVDWNEKSFQLQPENAFKLRKWSGNDDDTTLFDLAIFLRTIVANEVEDVRTVLGFYKQFDDPLAAFKENQRRLQEEQERANKLRLESGDRPPALVGSWSKSLFGRRH